MVITYIHVIISKEYNIIKLSNNNIISYSFIRFDILYLIW